MSAWLRELVEVVPFAAWAVSGLLAVLLQPSNAAARRLALAGLFLPLSRLVEYGVLEHPDASETLATSGVARWTGDTLFLLGLAALVGALATFPDGRPGTALERWAGPAMMGLASLASLGRLFGAPQLSIGGDPVTAVPNESFVPALRPIGAAAQVLVSSEPLWAVFGVGLLLVRYRRAGGARRAGMRWPLWALGGFVGTLGLTIATHAAYQARGQTLESPVLSGIFLLAFSLFPVSLVTTIAARTRQLQQEIASSRARIVRAEADTRRRMERDLHDGVQQHLVALLSLLQLATRQLDRAEVTAGRDSVAQAASQVGDAIADLRAVIDGIHPAALTDRGLVAAISDHLARPGTPVKVEAAPGMRRCSEAVEAAAFFVVCEALTNTLKYAGANEAVVCLDREKSRLRVRISDDGRGFDPSQVGLRGLLGARDRIESLGGAFTLRAAPGAGTSVEFELPAGARA